MTDLESIYSGKKLLVKSIISNSGKIHPYISEYVGTFGLCLGEAKNGMLLIKFGNHTRSIPSSCVIITSTNPISKTCTNERFKKHYV